MNELKKHLFDCYNGFADKRIKNLDKDSKFIVDDRANSDYDAKGDLFYWFCMLFVEVIDNDSVKVILYSKTDLPKNAKIGNEIVITKTNLNELNIIANKITNLVAKGKKYSVKSYMHICPRTAKSLRNLASNLGQFWNK